MKLPIYKWKKEVGDYKFEQWIFFGYSLPDLKRKFWYLIPSRLISQLWRSFYMSLGLVSKKDCMDTKNKEYFVTSTIQAGEWITVMGNYASKVIKIK